MRASLEVLTLQAKKELENEVVPWHIYLCFFQRDGDSVESVTKLAGFRNSS